MKKLRYLVGAIIGLILLGWVLRGLDWDKMVEAVQSADYAQLIPAGLAMLGMFALRTLRWKLLLTPLKRASFGALWSGILIGYFGNFALTANAGELIRAFVLGQREDLSKSAVLASIVIEKILDILVLVGFLSALALTLTLPQWMGTMIALAGLTFVVACLVLLFLPRWETRVAAWIGSVGSRIFPSLTVRAAHLLHTFVSGLQVWRRGQVMVGSIALTVLTWPCLGVTFFFIGRSLDLHVGAQAYLLLVTLITLGAIVPTLPGQVGTTEFFVVSGLAVFAVDKEQALTFVILLRLIRFLPLGLGYASLLRAGLGLSNIQSVQKDDLEKEKHVTSAL